MRKFLAMLLVFVMCISLIGCQPKEESTVEGNDVSTTEAMPEVQVEEDADLSSYTLVYYEEIPILNPYNLTNTTEMKMTANTLDGLVENDSTGKYIPSIAESWTSNDDYTVWTFKLKQGVKWVDFEGNETSYEVTADDFVEAMRYIANPDNTVTNVKIVRDTVLGFADYYYTILDIKDGIITGNVEDVYPTFDSTVGVKAIDDYTLEYTLEAPTPYFLSMLVTELFLPMEKEFVDTVGDSYGLTPDTMLYNGAYYLSQWQRDKQINLIANPFYWDKENVKIEKINMLKVADAATALEMFKRSEIDTVSLSGLQVESLKNSEYIDNVYTDLKSSVNYWFSLNFNSPNTEFNAFIQNDDFRKALYYGIDRSVMQQVFDAYNPSSNLTNTITPYGVVFDSNGVDYTDYPALKPFKELAENTYNPELAKEYMAKAIAAIAPDGIIPGVAASTIDMSPIAKFDVDGKLPITITFVDSQDSDNIMLAELFELTVEETFGTDVVDVQLAQFSNSKYDDVIQPGFYDMVYDSFSFKYADPEAQLSRLVTDGSINDGRYSDPVFDQMIEEAMAEINLEARYDLFSKAEAYFLDKAYIVVYKAAGGGYSMSRTDQFKVPYGGFGITRFKYKGMSKLDHILTKDEFESLKDEAGF